MRVPGKLCQISPNLTGPLAMHIFTREAGRGYAGSEYMHTYCICAITPHFHAPCQSRLAHANLYMYTHAHARAHTNARTCAHIIQTRTHKNRHWHKHTNTQRCRCKQRNPPTCTDSFAFVFLGPVPADLYQCVADFLQWCVDKCIAPISHHMKPASSNANLDAHAITRPFYLSHYSERIPPTPSILNVHIECCIPQPRVYCRLETNGSMIIFHIFVTF